jgi:hypothetical protein
LRLISRKAQRKKKAEPQARPAKKPTTAPTGRLWFLLAAALVPLLLYWPTTGYGFLLDDFVLFQTSPSLSELGSIPRGSTTDVGALRKGADTVISSYYRPVFLALSTIYYKLFGGGPASWHAASMLIAALIGALACAFFLRLVFSPPVALLASLVFSLHPAHVSSVAWASGLQELLAALFVGCALHMILTAKREDRDPRPLVGAVGALPPSRTLTPTPLPSPPTSLTGRGEKKQQDLKSKSLLVFLPLLPVREGGRGREKRAGVMRAYPRTYNASYKAFPGRTCRMWPALRRRRSATEAVPGRMGFFSTSR